jgi:hypothetical protein
MHLYQEGPGFAEGLACSSGTSYCLTRELVGVLDGLFEATIAWKPRTLT